MKRVNWLVFVTAFPGAMNTYETRKKEIERKQLKVEEAEQMMQRLKDKMTELKVSTLSWLSGSILLT